MIAVLVGILGLAVGIAGGVAVYKSIAVRRADTAEARAAHLMAEAEREAESNARQSLTGMRSELEQALAEEQRELERIGRLTSQEARETLKAQVVDQAKRDAMATV